MRALSADWVLLEDGFAPGLLIEHESGTITDIRPGRAAEHIEGAVLPGMTNLHSHAFQRSFAGRTEFAGGGGDFWSWREAMYRAAGNITPETAAPVAAYVAMLGLLGGFTSLVEFHYLQNAPDGRPYANRAAMADAIVEGARQAGVGLTLLFGVYQTGDFDGAPLRGGQIRFDTGPDAALRMLAEARAQEGPALRFGLSPHSLRAVPPDSLRALVAGAGAGTPIHMHLSEQVAEVAACQSARGAPPVAWLLDNAPVSPDWCLIHCTHASAAERAGIARSGAVVGLCPSTEGNLGDGIFGLPDFAAAGGVFGLGTDSHVSLDAFGELRLLEYSQRLRTQKRNVLAGADRHSGTTLWRAACAGGARAAGRDVGALRVGGRADMVVIGPSLESEAVGPHFWLDAAIFAQSSPVAHHVMAGGQWKVRDGRHLQQESITKAYREALKVLG